MPNFFTLGYRLPGIISIPLFGDRKRFGLTVNLADPCYVEWGKRYWDFYNSNQKYGIGRIVNDAGYRVMSRIELSGKRVLEIGPGEINHIDYWRGIPDHYVIADIQQKMLDVSAERLKSRGVRYSTQLVPPEHSKPLPFEDGEFDIIVSFYAFEHIYPFRHYLGDMLRVLKEGGKLVGAIPCEGGMAWGTGRFMTSRQWLKKNTSINPDKIICWEHPEFAENILKILTANMVQRHLVFWPLVIPSVDINLIVKFIYEKIKR